MGKIKVKAPCKINLSLKVGKKRPDGFHPIESVMAAVNLFDFIEIETFEGDGVKIASNSSEIPLDDTNIAYKAAKLFLKETGLNFGVNIYIEKNIPVAAGLAGGSTDAAGVIFGLNEISGMVLNKKDEGKLLSSLGSDLNFCMEGGMKLCRGRGEILEEAEFYSMPITIIKPKNLKISTKDAYAKFDEAVLRGEVSNLENDLEFALLPYYKELQTLHGLGFSMSGSGPSYFVKKEKLTDEEKNKLKGVCGCEYLIIENLKIVNHGVLRG